MSKSERRVALVTGGSRGIGLGIACSLAEAGFDLAINDRRSEEDVADQLAELKKLGAETLYCQADVGDLDDHRPLLDAVRKKFGKLNVLVNNTGVAPNADDDILEISERDFDDLIRANLRGPFFLTQNAAQWFVSQRKTDTEFSASVVNIAPPANPAVESGGDDYCGSKAGIAMATKLWASCLGEFGIPVYEIRPGIIQTDMSSEVTDKYNKLIGEGLLVESRWGLPEDVGRAVAMLATGQISYATGTVLPIDGGLTISRL